jgi:hypothetical protein
MTRLLGTASGKIPRNVRIVREPQGLHAGQTRSCERFGKR